MEKTESFLVSFSSFFSLRSGNRRICKQRVCISKDHLPSFLPRAHSPNCWWQPRWWRILCVPLGSTLVLLLPCHSRNGFFNYSRVAWSQSLVWGGHRPTLPHLTVQPHRVPGSAHTFSSLSMSLRTEMFWEIRFSHPHPPHTVVLPWQLGCSFSFQGCVDSGLRCKQGFSQHHLQLQLQLPVTLLF